MGFDNKYMQEIRENEHFTVIAHQEVENLYHENREMSEKIVKHLEELVESQKIIIDELKNKLKM